MPANETDKTKAKERLYDLLELQKELEQEFGNTEYNVFIFGSYPTVSYVEGKSDIDIAVYTENFDLYKRLSLYLEEYYRAKQISSDIFFIDTRVEAPFYCMPLKSKVQFTDYYPQKLKDFENRCQQKLEEFKEMVAG